MIVSIEVPDDLTTADPAQLIGAIDGALAQLYQLRGRLETIRDAPATAAALQAAYLEAIQSPPKPAPAPA